MKNKLKNIFKFSIKNIIIIWLIFSVFVWLMMRAIDTQNDWWMVNTNTTKTINVSWTPTCLKITNTNCPGTAIFVPTKTQAEWTAFLTRKPGCVSTGACWHRAWSSWTLIPRTSLGTNVSNPWTSYPWLIHAPVSSCGDDVYNARSGNPTGAWDCMDYILYTTWDNRANREFRSSDRCSQFAGILMSWNYCDGAWMDTYSVVRWCNDEKVGKGCVNNCKYIWAECGYYAYRTPVWVND